VTRKHLETHSHQESAYESQQWWHASCRNALKQSTKVLEMSSWKFTFAVTLRFRLGMGEFSNPAIFSMYFYWFPKRNRKSSKL